MINCFSGSAVGEEGKKLDLPGVLKGKRFSPGTTTDDKLQGEGGI